MLRQDVRGFGAKAECKNVKRVRGGYVCLDEDGADKQISPLTLRGFGADYPVGAEAEQVVAGEWGLDLSASDQKKSSNVGLLALVGLVALAMRR